MQTVCVKVSNECEHVHLFDSGLAMAMAMAMGYEIYGRTVQWQWHNVYGLHACFISQYNTNMYKYIN